LVTALGPTLTTLLLHRASHRPLAMGAADQSISPVTAADIVTLSAALLG
jgi:hypothetical protein